MKILSYLSLVIAGICMILALLARLFFDERIIFFWTNYLTVVSIFLLASIAFALHHLIMIKSK